MDPLLEKRQKPPDIISVSPDDQRAQHFRSLRQSLGTDSVFVGVKNYNDKEEATCIELAMLLNKDYCKRLFLVPLLSLISLFLFPLKLYWSKRMQADWLYKRAANLESASHLMVVGRGKTVEPLTLLARQQH